MCDKVGVTGWGECMSVWVSDECVSRWEGVTGWVIVGR